MQRWLGLHLPILELELVAGQTIEQAPTGRWLESHPVLEALRQRRASDSRPGSRSDPWKIGLAVEGGGMRGIVSAAMLTAIEDLGFHNAFDDVYAASSGAINTAYFLATNTWYPLSIYYDDLACRKFVDFRRALTGRPILDMEYAFENVVEVVKPLDFAAVLAAPIRFHVSMTSVDEMRTMDVSDFENRADLKQALRGSAWLPVAVPGTAVWRGQRVVDGGLLTAFPFRLALRDGCTHILSLSTRPVSTPQHRHSVTQRFAASRINKLRAGLGTGYLRAVREGWEDRRNLQRQMLAPTEEPAILDLAPLPWMPQVKRHEISLGRLLTGARTAYGVMYCALANVSPDRILDNTLRVIPRLTAVEHVVPLDATSQLSSQ
ncbi:patatin-like phospholipase family protein [Plantactinospora sp. CA-290183]|uniref:patatin-like phospholipase family protein n=1 Tax=Plantactinospora sp. CA-290183 TaxID=3240006 RepID=UPI003D94AEFB